MSQDNKKSIVMYQGDGSNNVFSVPMTKGKFGTISVAFVRRGLEKYELNPTTFYLNEENTLLTWTGATLKLGDFIVIQRTTTLEQPFEFQNNQKHLEKSDDNLERQIQELADKVNNSLRIDPTHAIDSDKMNPIDWLETIVRSTDKSVRGLKFENHLLSYSLDDPNIAEEDKTWTAVLNTLNVTHVREYNHRLQYSVDGGVIWKAIGDGEGSIGWGNIVGNIEDQSDLKTVLDRFTTDLEGKANIDLDNLTPTGQNIPNWSTNITDCISKIPQNIIYEFDKSAGEITLKAGSKVYFPNGFDSDNERVFDEMEIASDMVLNSGDSIWNYALHLSFIKSTGDTSAAYHIDDVYSGDVAPTLSAARPNAIWYDTANNVIKVTSDSGTTWSVATYSLPIIVFRETASSVNSVENVFNGFGFMANAAFVLPGVEGIAPNGRNEDGTLKNIKESVTGVRIHTGYSGHLRTRTDVLMLDSATLLTIDEQDVFVDNYPAVSVTEWSLVYDTQKNQYFVSDYGTPYESSIRCNTRIKIHRNPTTGRIESMDKVIQPFRLDERANTNLDNLTSAGKNIANWSANVSNCLINTPRPFDFTVENGYAKMFNGSKVYVPKGLDANNKPIFDEIVVNSDKITTFTTPGLYMVCYNPATDALDVLMATIDCSSGSDWNVSTLYALRYNAAENLVKFTTDTGATWSTPVSLPLCIVEANSSGISAINNLFTPFGFIGQHLWVLPGVKGLRPNGRNIDGTYKNTLITVSEVHMSSAVGLPSYRVFLGNDGYLQTWGVNTYRECPPVVWTPVNEEVWYDTQHNYMFMFDGTKWVVKSDGLYLGSVVKTANGNISYMNIRTTFRAADYNDLTAAVFNMVYPVGALYFTEENTNVCPIEKNIPGSTWQLVSSGRALWGGDGTNAGTTIAAGLPNVYGVVGGVRNDTQSLTPNGAFSAVSSAGGFDGSAGLLSNVDCNASRVSSVFGQSTTVQPPAYVVNVWKRTA